MEQGAQRGAPLLSPCSLLPAPRSCVGRSGRYGARLVFTLLGTDPTSKARRGRLVTRHGAVETPVFMPVGTQGTVKGQTIDMVRQTGA